MHNNKQKASIKQTCKIAKSLGGKSLEWIDNLSYQEAQDIIDEIDRKTPFTAKYRSYFIGAVIVVIVLCAVVGLYLTQNKPVEKVVYKPIIVEKVVSPTPTKQVISRPVIERIKPYSSDQIHFANLKTIDLIQSVYLNAAVFVSQTKSTSDKTKPMRISGTINENGVKTDFTANFSNPDNWFAEVLIGQKCLVKLKNGMVTK